MSDPHESAHVRFRTSDLAARIARRDIVLTITAGRSGTRLLQQLCRHVLAVDARHEPEPKANFALRPMLAGRRYGLRWLVAEKLPAIAAYGNCPTYVETSNMYGKEFLELIFELGIVPRFIVLRYDASRIGRRGRLGATGSADVQRLPIVLLVRVRDAAPAKSLHEGFRRMRHSVF